MLTNVPSKQDIEEAHGRVRPFVHCTPVLTSESLNKKTGCSLFFKCENLQRGGAFKYRGATNAVQQLSLEQRERGVATHSSGNHGQALARAASVSGIKSYIVMPENAPQVKVNAVKEYGGKVIFCGPSLAARESKLRGVIDETGATVIHPFDNYDVIAGQATCAKEFFEDTENLDVIAAPVGGGGLLSGTALSAHYYSPETEVWAGEPEQVNDALLSMKKGEIVPAPDNPTIADGLRTSLGEKTFPIIRRHIYGILTVSEPEIAQGMRHLWERLKVVVEPSAAVPYAAILRNKVLFSGKRVGIILSGGNVDLEKLPF